MRKEINVRQNLSTSNQNTTAVRNLKANVKAKVDDNFIKQSTLAKKEKYMGNYNIPENKKSQVESLISSKIKKSELTNKASNTSESSNNKHYLDDKLLISSKSSTDEKEIEKEVIFYAKAANSEISFKSLSKKRNRSLNNLKCFKASRSLYALVTEKNDSFPTPHIPKFIPSPETKRSYKLKVIGRPVVINPGTVFTQTGHGDIEKKINKINKATKYLHNISQKKTLKADRPKLTSTNYYRPLPVLHHTNPYAAKMYDTNKKCFEEVNNKVALSDNMSQDIYRDKINVTPLPDVSIEKSIRRSTRPTKGRLKTHHATKDNRIQKLVTSIKDDIFTIRKQKYENNKGRNEKFEYQNDYQFNDPNKRLKHTKRDTEIQHKCRNMKVDINNPDKARNILAPMPNMMTEPQAKLRSESKQFIHDTIAEGLIDSIKDDMSTMASLKFLKEKGEQQNITHNEELNKIKEQEKNCLMEDIDKALTVVADVRNKFLNRHDRCHSKEGNSMQRYLITDHMMSERQKLSRDIDDALIKIAELRKIFV